jgi:UDPglucose--hexose-1-phosphate uridylyltransferase
VRKTSLRLSDGREVIYFGTTPERPADYLDLRGLRTTKVESELRYDQLLGEWIVVASHRRERTFRPNDDQCPLCPSTVTHQTEVPAPTYGVVVFENRFPALGTSSRGRCEVVCFSQDHNASFGDLSPAQVATVLAAWIDRTTELSKLPGVEQVYCFENRGCEVGVTLSHPHGQIYAYPFVTPRTARMLSMCSEHRQRTGLNLFDQVVAGELADGSRIVASGDHWVAFVPHATRWAQEVHLYPIRRVPDLAALTGAAKAEFCDLYLDMLSRFDRLSAGPTPYISAVHQAPVRQGREEFALHIELFSTLLAPARLQHLAGSELGMGVFATHIVAEESAERLRELGCAQQPSVRPPSCSR